MVPLLTCQQATIYAGGGNPPSDNAQQLYWPIYSACCSDQCSQEKAVRGSHLKYIRPPMHRLNSRTSPNLTEGTQRRFMSPRAKLATALGMTYSASSLRLLFFSIKMDPEASKPVATRASVRCRKRRFFYAAHFSHQKNL